MISNIQIGYPVVLLENDRAKLVAKVAYRQEQRSVYYSLPLDYAHWFAVDRCDGFVVGLLLQAMALKENLVVEGPLSSRIYHSLQGFFIPMMARAFPNLQHIEILPSCLTDDPALGEGVATGFSGGIDSLATIVQHLVNENSVGHKITHFLFHNVGSHGCGRPEDSRRLFLQRYEKIRPFADEVGVPAIPVDSNLAEVFPVDFIRMHPALNASVPLILQNQFQRFYYASAYKYSDCGVDRIDDIARFDPFAFHLFSTEGLDCVSTGGQMSRVEKTRLIAGYQPSYRYLNVCVDPSFEGHNCSVCFKCCRTQLTLELLGVAERYNNVFDPIKFNKVRNRYLLEVLRYERGSFEAELAELARQRSIGLFAGVFWSRHIWDRLLGR